MILSSGLGCLPDIEFFCFFLCVITSQSETSAAGGGYPGSGSEGFGMVFQVLRRLPSANEEILCVVPFCVIRMLLGCLHLKGIRWLCRALVIVRRFFLAFA